MVCRCARTAAATAAGGAVVAVAATTLLAARHTLAGPTMVRSGSALAETLIAISAGVVVDAVLAVLGHPGLGAELMPTPLAGTGGPVHAVVLRLVTGGRWLRSRADHR